MQPQTVRRVSVAIAEQGGLESTVTPVILVVTPDTDLRAALERVIGREGYKVMTAAHAGHAVLACLSAGRVDVLLAELSMDDLSGPALTERLRRHCPAMATVFFANSGTPECDGVIVRPFTRDDVLVALARAATERVAPTSAS